MNALFFGICSQRHRCNHFVLAKFLSSSVVCTVRIICAEISDNADAKLLARLCCFEMQHRNAAKLAYGVTVLCLSVFVSHPREYLRTAMDANTFADYVVATPRCSSSSSSSRYSREPIRFTYVFDDFHFTNDFSECA